MSVYTFLCLDKEFHPIKLISNAHLNHTIAMSVGTDIGNNTGGLSHNVTFRDLCDPGYTQIPTMDFEY